MCRPAGGDAEPARATAVVRPDIPARCRLRTRARRLEPQIARIRWAGGERPNRIYRSYKASNDCRVGGLLTPQGQDAMLRFTVSAIVHITYNMDGREAARDRERRGAARGVDRRGAARDTERCGAARDTERREAARDMEGERQRSWRGRYGM
jgi:hypothetical protein